MDCTLSNFVILMSDFTAKGYSKLLSIYFNWPNCNLMIRIGLNYHGYEWSEWIASIEVSFRIVTCYCTFIQDVWSTDLTASWAALAWTDLNMIFEPYKHFITKEWAEILVIFLSSKQTTKTLFCNEIHIGFIQDCKIIRLQDNFTSTYKILKS